MVKLHVMGLVEQQNGLPLKLVCSDPFQIISLPLKTCLHFAGTTYMVHFHFVSNETIQEVDAALQQWFSEWHTLKGTHTAPQHLVCRVVPSLHINHMQMSIIEVFICRRLHMNTSMILICIWLICRLGTTLHAKCCGAVSEVS